MHVLRDANVTCRWLLLHTSAVSRRLKELLPPTYDPDKLLLLLLLTGQFEFVLKGLLSMSLWLFVSLSLSLFPSCSLLLPRCPRQPN
jgi:hypothetical protein